MAQSPPVCWVYSADDAALGDLECKHNVISILADYSDALFVFLQAVVLFCLKNFRAINGDCHTYIMAF